MSSNQTVSGTQSPPVHETTPMGASSIKGGNAGGVPDAQQRGSYFPADTDSQRDAPNSKETAGATSAPTRALNAEHQQPHSVWEAGATGSGPFKEMSGEQVKDVLGRESSA